MRGAEELIALRRRGYRPEKGVVVCMSAMPIGKTYDDGLSDTGCAGIDIGSDEVLARLDFRCLIGLRVVVTGSDESRIMYAASLIEQAGASGVVGLTYGEAMAENWLYSCKPWTEAA
jgi:hypothetical protein